MEEKIIPKYEPGQNFFKKLDNFWYHNKWKVIITVFFAVVFLVCGLQTCSREEVDLYLMYAGPYKFGKTDASSIKSAFGEVVHDRTGDGIGKVELVDIYILSDEQIMGELEAMGEAGEGATVNYEMFESNREAFSQQILAGDTVICLLDPHLYDSVYELDEDKNRLSGFMKLSEVLGYTPNYAYDEYAVRVGDTPLAEYYSILRDLDEDTLLCIRELSSMSFLKGQKRTEEYHNYCLEVFKNIFEFEVKQ